MLSSIECRPFSEDETERVKKAFETVGKLGERYIRTVPGNVVLPKSYERFKDYLKSWKIRKDDIYICGFPKNGTTWTQELVWLIQNDLDFQRAKSVELENRSPYLELPVMCDVIKDQLHKSHSNHYQEIERMPSPRLLKTHRQFCLLPDDLLNKCKVVMCMRNPKDTVVSKFHHDKRTSYYGYIGNFSEYFDLYMSNMVVWTSYFEYICQAWEKRHHQNLCILFYEEMKRDQLRCIKRVSEFLGKDLTTEQVAALADHLSFDKMKTNKAVNATSAFYNNIYNKGGEFMRKGEVGDWKNYFTEEMNKRMDKSIEKYLKPIGIDFQYE